MVCTAEVPKGKRLNAPTGTNTNLLRLLIIFCCWKVLLLLIAVASPGPGYDTSADISLDHGITTPKSWLDLLVLKLTRWDAIYFVSSSMRGYVFEQEWAFSRTFAKITSVISSVLSTSVSRHDFVLHGMAGAVLSHVTHLHAVVVLYFITRGLIPTTASQRARIAFTAACLHIVSPAGIFLSASYGESFFAATNFTGMLCYTFARRHGRQHGTLPSFRATALTLASGLLFGIATMIRSNGLLSGIPLAWDAFSTIPSILTLLRNRNWQQLIQFASTLVGGVFVAFGYVLPQFEAYMEFCTSGNTRPWCDATLPSIYTYVQNHYWNVGFLRYWTLSNLPLFVLAAPVLLVLLCTSGLALNPSQLDAALCVNSHSDHGKASDFHRTTMARLALPQAILAILALTSFHVQIINRISSGYPIWYIVLAIAVQIGTNTETPGAGRLYTALSGHASLLVRASIMYAVIQAGLYASFMPPA